jgi:hypothetical protein
MEGTIVLAISLCVIILILVIEEARISQLKNIIAYPDKAKIPNQQLFALLVIFQRMLSKSYERNRDYGKALQHLYDNHLTRFPTQESLLTELMDQKCFTRDWSKERLTSANLRRLLKDKAYYTVFLKEFNKNNNEKTS